MSNTSETTFWAAYKHPKWQEKRLKVMNRARFECEYCGDNETQLQVHHSYYERGAKPWEYPDEALQVLCEPCHQRETVLTRDVRRAVGMLSSATLEQLLGYAENLVKRYSDDPSATVQVNRGYEHLCGVADAYDVNPHAIMNAIEPGTETVPVQWLRDLFTAQVNEICALRAKAAE